MSSKTGIGASVRRFEDQRFLTGKGTYTDDIQRPGQLYAYILRSPHAHATIAGIDIRKAAAAPGVVAIFTGADMAADKIGGLPCGWQIHSKDGTPMAEPPHPALAADTVRHVGDQVAVIIAERRSQARDAAELVEVNYQPLPAVVSTGGALAAGAPKVHAGLATGNLCYDWHLGDGAAVDAAIAKAAHVTTLELTNSRLIPNAMEPRAYIAEYDRATDETTLYTTSQNPHVIRLLMGAFVLSIPEHKLRVVAPDVGGGFGSKIFHYPEEVIVTWAARKLARPVKWVAERGESFLADAHGRDHITRVQLALDKAGKFTALKVATTANMGAYLSTFAPAIPTYLYGTLLAGQYTTPSIYVEVKAVFTHTAPVDAYRGAGRPEACYLLERVVDVAADELGIDPAELRRRNMIPAEAMPYATPVALTYDTGKFSLCLDKALQLIDYQGFAARRAKSEKEGKLRGIGLCSYIEACGIAPSNVAGALGARAGLYESGEVRFHPTGSVTVFTGAHSHGQGHETTFAQLISDKLGVPIENVSVVHGDTAKTSMGMGTYGSRSLAVGGSAIVKAIDKVIAKARKIAAFTLEAAESDIEFQDGRFTVKGTDKSLGIGDVALSAYVPHKFPLDELEPGLDEQAFYDPKNFTFPNGTQICEIEIEPATGVTRIVAFVAADDFGRIINPMIVEGQVHGGLAQGIGQALLESCVYDAESGQLVTGSYMDYCMPRADDLPNFVVSAHEEAPCTHNPLGVKGCGEAGTIGAAAAVMNAVVDALKPYGVRHIDMPATPEKVWRAIRDASPAKAAE